MGNIKDESEMKKRITISKEMAKEIMDNYEYLDMDMGSIGIGTRENIIFFRRLKKTFGIKEKYFFDKIDEKRSWIKYYRQHDEVYWGREKAIELAKERMENE